MKKSLIVSGMAVFVLAAISVGVAQAQKAATQAVRQIVDRFCEGSVERLLQGMVSDRLLTAEQLEELARKIAESEARGKEKLS